MKIEHHKTKLQFSKHNCPNVNVNIHTTDIDLLHFLRAVINNAVEHYYENGVGMDE